MTPPLQKGELIKKMDNFNSNHNNTSNNSSSDGNVFNISKTPINHPVTPKKTRKNEIDEYKNILLKNAPSPLWVSVSEAAKLGGITTKTVRRALQSEKITYKVEKNRYLIDLRSIILYLHTKTKLKNKLNDFGIGQYIEKWR